MMPLRGNTSLFNNPNGPEERQQPLQKRPNMVQATCRCRIRCHPRGLATRPCLGSVARKQKLQIGADGPLSSSRRHIPRKIAVAKLEKGLVDDEEGRFFKGIGCLKSAPRRGSPTYCREQSKRSLHPCWSEPRGVSCRTNTKRRSVEICLPRTIGQTSRRPRPPNADAKARQQWI